MTLKIFQKCDNNYDWSAYVRIGLYYVMRDGERANFCDVHVGWVPGEPIDLGAYSGPTDSTKKITRYNRSRAAENRFRDTGEVAADLALAQGGISKLVHSSKRKSIDVWMFGPVVSEGVAYGSLVAELEGLEFGSSTHKYTTTDPKTGKERETTDPKYQRYLVNFPKNYGQRFHPCKLFSSAYSEGNLPRPVGQDNHIVDGGSTVHYKDDRAPGEKLYVKPGPPPALIDLLKSARASLQPAFLPKGAIKVVWKIEDFADQQTACQIYDRGG